MKSTLDIRFGSKGNSEALTMRMESTLGQAIKYAKSKLGIGGLTIYWIYQGDEQLVYGTSQSIFFKY